MRPEKTLEWVTNSGPLVLAASGLITEPQPTAFMSTQFHFETAKWYSLAS